MREPKEERTSGAKAREWLHSDTARLKSCPDTKPNLSANNTRAHSACRYFIGVILHEKPAHRKSTGKCDVVRPYHLIHFEPMVGPLFYQRGHPFQVQHT